MQELEIRLLGPLTVRRADGSFVEPADWRTTKVKDLLRLLALDAGAAVPVATIVDRLWPGADPAHARSSLRTATYQLRKVLRSDCIERTGAALTLRTAWTDVRAFREAADAVAAHAPRRLNEQATVVGLVRDAEALYLADPDLHESADDGLLEESARLRALRVRLLVEGAEAAGELLWTRESLTFARRAFRLDPASERAGRALMRALGGLGETTKALAVYERVCGEIAERYGADPAPQTHALHLRLIDGARWVDRSTRPRVGLPAIADRLATELVGVRKLGRAGVLVVRAADGSGWERALTEACDGLGISVDRLGLEATDALAPEFRADPTSTPRADVLILPTAGAVTAPVRSLVGDLARRLRATLVVPVPEGVELPDRRLDWPGVGEVPVVTIARLDEDGLGEVARTVLQGDPSPALVRALTMESAGRAGSACDLLHRWLDEGRIVWTDAGLDVRPLDTRAFPTGGSARGYLTGLSRSAVDVLSVLCLTGGSVSAAQAGAVLSEWHPGRAADLPGALEELVNAALVASHPGGFAPTPLAAAGDLAAWLAPKTRRRLHCLIAEVIVTCPQERIRHWTAAGRHQLACDAGIAALTAAPSGDPHIDLLVDSLRRLSPSLLVRHADNRMLGPWLEDWLLEHRPDLADTDRASGVALADHCRFEHHGHPSLLRRARFRVHSALVGATVLLPDFVLPFATV